MPRHNSEDPDDPNRALGRAATDDLEGTPSGLDETQPAPPPVSLGLDETAIATHHSAETAETLSPPSIAAGSTVGGKARDKPRNRATRGSIPIGQHIDRFLVEGELGAGGMGVVYAAFDPKLDRKVAIKMLHEGLSSSQRARLEREARAMAKLSHPNVVSVHEVGELNGRLYVAMEFVEGKNLREWLKEDKPDRETILVTMIAAGRGLAAAHKADMVHRDFKPDNILVGKSGRPRVSDFGLVSAFDPSDSLIESQERHLDTPVPASDALTVVGAIMGTPLYMAPEQHRGEPTDHKADQFSFCATLWEALFDQPPFSANSYDALVEKVTSGDISLSKRALKAPKWLRKVLLKGLAARPDDRYENMEAVLAALDRSAFRRRRNAAVIAAALLAVGGGSYVFAGSTKDKGSSCSHFASELNGVWDNARKGEIIKAFAATQHARSERKAQLVTKALDAYADDWLARRTQVCEETQKDGAHSPVFYERSVRCFDDSLIPLRALVDLYRRADESVVEGATKHLRDLNELSVCTNEETLNQLPLPDQPNAYQRARVLFSRLQDIKNLLRKGDNQSALPLLEELAKEAREFDYPPLSAEVITQLGSVQMTLGDLAGAEASFSEAAEQAARGKEDSRIAEIWIKMLELLSAQARTEEALALETVAVASAKRVSENVEIQARLANALGGLYLAKADYQRVKKEYTKALELQRTIPAPNDMLAPAIANVGLALWYTGDLDGAEEHFVESLGLLLKDYGPDHALVAYARKNIGDLQRTRGDYAGATENYLEVLRVWKLTLGEEHANLAYAYETLATLYAETGDVTRGLEYARKTLEIREKSVEKNHPLMSQAYSVLARTLVTIGTEESLAEAEEYAKQGLSIDLELGEDGKRTLPFSYDQLAQIARARGKLAEAISYFENSLNVRLTTLGPDHPHTTQTTMNLAGLLVSNGNHDKALNLLAELDGRLAAMEQPDRYSLLTTKRLLAELHMARGDKQATESALTALEKVFGLFGDESTETPEVRFGLLRARYILGMEERAVQQAKELLREASPITRITIETWLDSAQ